MGESLQDFAKFNSESIFETTGKYDSFSIHKLGLKYYVTTSKIVNAEDISSLSRMVDFINFKMEKDPDYRQLEYDFRKKDDKQSYFFLNIELSKYPKDNFGLKDGELKYSLENLKKLIELLDTDNVILFFKGVFNQNSLLNLLTIVESQFKESSITVKIYSLLIEMLQNISKHADNFHQEVNLKPGIFIITENEDKLNLVSGNYIRNNKIEKLKETLNYINCLSNNDLEKEYNDTLLNFEFKDKKEDWAF
jgi:hypothetical protein